MPAINWRCFILETLSLTRNKENDAVMKVPANVVNIAIIISGNDISEAC